MSRGRFLRWGFVGLFIVILVVAGCGKKGDPIPPIKNMLALSVSLSGFAIEAVGNR